MTTRWIKFPKPGEFRGEGTWESYDDFVIKSKFTPEAAQIIWDELQVTKYLPTKEEDNDG